MRHPIVVALRVTVVTLALTGIGYPLVVTGAAQWLFAEAANGTLVHDARGRVIGSALIGQRFDKPAYLQGRPSAAGEKGFDAMSSSGSNLGPTSKKLRDRVEADAKRLRTQNPDAAAVVPLELVTTSGSGLDPHVSPGAAPWQVTRIARARGVPAERIQSLLSRHIEGRELGLFGERRVNVLRVNLDLDRHLGAPAP
jgi:potassium-transporting ATPase KdpC subunit